MYISLKDGWASLADLCEKYEKDKGNMNRILDKMDANSKEKIGNVWIVKESEFVKNIRTNKDFKQSDMEILNEIVDKFTDILSKKLNIEEVKNKLGLKTLDNDYVIKTFMEWSLRCHTNFPNEIYEYINKEGFETYTKFLLIQQLWNKVLEENSL